MTDIITIIAFLNLVEYTYTFVKVAGRYYSYMEVSKKIQYYENIETIYNLSRKMKTKRNKNKKKVIYMGKVGKTIIQFVADVSLYSLERSAEKREKSNLRLHEARKQRAKRKEVTAEKELFEMGYLKDVLSQHYISCQDLLLDIYDALVAKYPHETDLFKRYILNVDSEEFDETDFVELEKHLIYVKVEDRLTELDFRSELLPEPIYKPSSIVWLQQKKKKLYKVNQVVIQHEHACAPSKAGKVV
tara:strand:+ start:1403 stop:2137 length:735 start_codon:yes stop_codon:yes gene_type:complete